MITQMINFSLDYDDTNLLCFTYSSLALFTSGQSNDLCFDPVTNVTLICNENAGCIARGNSTTCTCSSGFTGNGTHCSRKGECHNDTSCPSHSICINDTLGVLMCKCKHGYSKRGAECSEENECAILGNLCHRRASCNNETGLHTCQCVTGFEGNGTFCEGKQNFIRFRS